ncbi:MAG: hypothetical protein PVJ57_17665 [Phycisphaerae bacterium]|jgi:hypothetical protein
MTTTNRNAKTNEIRLDAALKRFLRETASCQSPSLAAWATQILRAGRMTMSDLERCLNLGFEF